MVEPCSVPKPMALDRRRLTRNWLGARPELRPIICSPGDGLGAIPDGLRANSGSTYACPKPLASGPSTALPPHKDQAAVRVAAARQRSKLRAEVWAGSSAIQKPSTVTI